MRVHDALLVMVCGLAGCGGDDDGVDTGADASIDAAAAAVSEVDCGDVTPAVTITTAGGEYAPSSSTISRGEVAEFQLTAGHTATSLTDQFQVGQGEHRCFRFAVADTYGFYCQVHGFTGELRVE